MAQKTGQKGIASLPAVIELVRPVRGITPAPFLSQLLAERGRLEPQREKRRAPVNQAVDAYRVGGNITLRRMPQGYRKTLVI